MNIYYFAYGTNLNKKIFLKKFKEAKLIKKYNLKNFKVVFRTKYKIPDLQKKIKSKVPGVIYRINRDIEKKLDKYEEYPKVYIKRYFKNKNSKIMFYFMKKKSPEVKPNGYYFKIMMQGYRQNNFKFINTFSKHL
ncbi:gamma-glutamylcyclotransferase family protein [Candidatus Pelagibacter communis]|uniref:gamma-glutamylcyclotransferase family protein n=1 Tax=Pelagibacter ubique TaxID=198252 RepID=UPI0015CF5202|nr:gamma-glutamylcyclotransferase family protein [Candidatus Pelagibacter ubique]